MLLVICYWLKVIGYMLLVMCYWLCVIGPAGWRKKIITETGLNN